MCEVAERLEQKGKAEIIISMLSKGVSVEDIADLTGVDLTFVKEVASKQKIK